MSALCNRRCARTYSHNTTGVKQVTSAELPFGREHRQFEQTLRLSPARKQELLHAKRPPRANSWSAPRQRICGRHATIERGGRCLPRRQRPWTRGPSPISGRARGPPLTTPCRPWLSPLAAGGSLPFTSPCGPSWGGARRAPAPHYYLLPSQFVLIFRRNAGPFAPCKCEICAQRAEMPGATAHARGLNAYHQGLSRAFSAWELPRNAVLSPPSSFMRTRVTHEGSD